METSPEGASNAPPEGRPNALPEGRPSAPPEGSPSASSRAASSAKSESEIPRRVRARFGGRVQGVGFRPFVDRVARRMAVTGSIRNAGSGALVEAQGAPSLVEAFLLEIERSAPGVCRLRDCEEVPLLASDRFEILPSAAGDARPALALPDLAPCEDCLRELRDPADPRHRHPFVACTACGPRYSVTESLPFDRVRTSMRDFPLHGRCKREYEDPADRRFHAEMIAAPDCGPRIELRDGEGTALAAGDDALARAGDAIRAGGILALQGVGGFQLLCDARSEEAVARLRARKGREAKPFAVLVADLAGARALGRVDDVEARALASPEAPIVLLERRHASLAPSVAPGLATLGVMLPASPLHHLLVGDLGFPVVATSGNRSGEPLCTGVGEALARLGSIADVFLVHDRRIVRPLDDSVVRVIGGRAVVLRLGRGLAPLPLELPASRGTALAFGAHMKAAPALLMGDHVVLGAHVGELDSEAAREALARAGQDLETFFGVGDEVVCDAHPDYASTRLAERRSDAPRRVGHHHAHVLACQLDQGDFGEVLGVAWDGTGLGPDGTLWGGELLRVDGARCERVAHLRGFALPGGSAAIREPLRIAAVLLQASFGAVPPVGPFAEEAARARAQIWTRLSGPETTSAGRLFDGVAALLGLCARSRYEGEAAMRLEAAAGRDVPMRPEAVAGRDAPIGLEVAAAGRAPGTIALPIVEADGTLVLDWAPMVRRIVADLEAAVPVAAIAARFHRALALSIAQVAERLGAERVVLTGGCFQNRLLTELAIEGLRERGIAPLWHARVPPNDGGIAAGQALAAWHAREG